jgi:hypothetical protein
MNTHQWLQVGHHRRDKQAPLGDLREFPVWSPSEHDSWYLRKNEQYKSRVVSETYLNQMQLEHVCLGNHKWCILMSTLNHIRSTVVNRRSPMNLWPDQNSFAEDMMQKGYWGLRKAAAEIDRLTTEHIEFSLAGFLANRKNRRANKDVEYYSLKVAQDMLGYFMGENRFMRDVMSHSDSFLGIREDNESSYRYLARACPERGV